MAAARRQRRNKRVRFRSHRGVKSHGGSVFRAHHARSRPVFRAHAPRALKGFRARAVKPRKAPKTPAYKGIGARKPHPARAKAAKFRSALPSAPAAWRAKKRRVAKYKAARPRGL